MSYADHLRRSWLRAALVLLLPVVGCGPNRSDQAARRPLEDSGPLVPPDPSTSGTTPPAPGR